MKYLYHGFVLRAINPELLPMAEIIPEPGDVAPVQMALMQLPDSVKRPIKTRGHAMPPGSGPDGETCGTCASLIRKKGTERQYLKCFLTASKWTGGSGSDVRGKDPACSKWTRKFGQ